MTVDGHNGGDWFDSFIFAGELCRVIKSIFEKELFLQVDQGQGFTR